MTATGLEPTVVVGSSPVALYQVTEIDKDWFFLNGLQNKLSEKLFPGIFDENIKKQYFDWCFFVKVSSRIECKLELSFLLMTVRND